MKNPETVLQNLKQITEGKIVGAEAKVILRDSIAKKDFVDIYSRCLHQHLMDAEIFLVYGTIERPGKHQAFR